MIRHSYSIHRRRGSALGAAMIVALAIALLLGGLIQWSGTERDITVRHVARAKAQMAAEGVDQYGAAQIKARLDKLIYFADDEFRPDDGGSEVKVSTLVHELLESGATGIGQALNEAKGTGSGNPTPAPPPMLHRQATVSSATKSRRTISSSAASRPPAGSGHPAATRSISAIR